MFIRYALVSARRRPGRRLPARQLPGRRKRRRPDRIAGRDVAGWTLDAYVIPRLASGLYFATEIDLSHPALKQLA